MLYKNTVNPRIMALLRIIAHIEATVLIRIIAQSRLVAQSRIIASINKKFNFIIKFIILIEIYYFLCYRRMNSSFQRNLLDLFVNIN